MKKFTQYKAVLPNYNARKSSQKGFTLLETLATMSMGSIILGAGLLAYLQIQENVARQTLNNDLSQRSRLVFSLLGPDLQQIGERIDSEQLKAVEIKQQTGTNNSIITVRRGSKLNGLTLCKDIEEGSNDPVNVIDGSLGQSGACIGSDGNNDGWPDDIKRWRDKRTADGGILRPYILDLASGEGEFFDYHGEEIKDGNGAAMTPSAGNIPETVNITTNGHTWERDYRAGNASIFLFEERTYQLDPEDGVLQLIANDQTFDVVEDIEKLEIVAIVQETLDSNEYRCTVVPPVDPTHCEPVFTGTFAWHNIKSIEVTVTPRVPQNRGNQLIVTDPETFKLTRRFYPRNRNNL